MLTNIKDWVEAHPYLAGSLAVGIIILWYLYSASRASTASSGSSGVAGTGLSSADYASLQEAQLAASTQLQAQQTQANAQVNSLNAQLQATQLSTAATEQANQLQAQVALQQVVSAQNVSNNQTAAQVAIANIQTGGQVQVAAIGAQENEAVTGIQAGVLEQQYQDALMSQQTISAAQTSQAQANADVQESLLQTISGFIQPLATTAPAGSTSTPVQTTTNYTTPVPVSASGGPISFGALSVQEQQAAISQGYTPSSTFSITQIGVLDTLFGKAA